MTDDDALDRKAMQMCMAALDAYAKTPDWLTEQYDAAIAEAAQLAEDLDGFISILPDPSGRVQVLLHDLMVETMAFGCPHLQPGQPLVAIAVLDTGYVGCRTCIENSPPEVTEPDEHDYCLICGLPAWRYCPLVVAGGTIVYLIEVCSRCWLDLVEVLEEDPDAD